MRQALSSRTWRGTLSLAQTPALALGLLALLLAIVEVAARTDIVRSKLPPPSVGSPSRILEVQLDRLRTSAARRGGVDCIVFGNSLTFFGFDPVAFSAAYSRSSGQPIRCYNFGVLGLTASGVGPLARVLAEDYHPWLLLYAVSARDLTWVGDDPSVAGMRWLQYRSGVFSIEGWITDNSYAYRYYLMYRSTPNFDIPQQLRQLTLLSPEGFLATQFTLTDRNAKADIFKRAAERTLESGVSPAQWSGFGKFLDLRTGGWQPVVVEMPIHPSLASWLATSDVYARTVKQVRAETRRRRTAFWRKRSWEMIPDSGWADLSHLNAHGAAVFSRWLGERVALAVREGKLTPGVTR